MGVAADAKRTLIDAAARGQIVRVTREELEEGWIEGYVAGIGHRLFALLEIVNAARFDGYHCRRYADVTVCEVPAPYADFMAAALRARGVVRPPDPRLNLLSMQAMLRSGGEIFPTVTIHLERLKPNVCYIGKIVSLSARQVLLREISTEGEWLDDLDAYNLRDIDKVSLGGEYEESLLLVAGDPPPLGG
jgi:hypothetical protein